MSAVQAALDRRPFPIEEPFREPPTVNSSSVELASILTGRVKIPKAMSDSVAYLHVQEDDGAAPFVLVFHEFVGVFTFFFGHFLKEFMVTCNETLAGTATEEGEKRVSYLSELHPLDRNGATMPCKHSWRTVPD